MLVWGTPKQFSKLKEKRDRHELHLLAKKVDFSIVIEELGDPI